ncbi:hypothetical protein [Streptomyces tendae]|uniref:hypothetical protein n=1 Tax=Streptomyces tendae TaxID=1932 RepID=UPI00364EF32C
MIKQRAAESSPNGKADMLYALVSMLTTPEEVPQQLRDISTQVQALACRSAAAIAAAACAPCAAQWSAPSRRAIRPPQSQAAHTH